MDILVNNAGLALGKNSVEENVTSDIVRMMTTNVTALIIATTLFTKGMKQRGRGHVINVGSIAGHYAYGGGSGYCASKCRHGIHVRRAARPRRHAYSSHLYFSRIRGN